jgi:hypothetical protein
MRIATAAMPFVVAVVTGAAAEPITLDRQAIHSNGTVLIVRSVEPLEDSTRVAITVTTADREVALNRNNSMALVDTKGAEYRLVPPADNESVAIPANSRMKGEMVFSGRLDPKLDRVVLVTNQGNGGSSDNRFSTLPTFRIELPLRAPATAEVPAADAGTEIVAAPAPATGATGSKVFTVDKQVNHPNGTVLLVRGLEATADGTLVDLKVTTGDRDIVLNRANSMHLIDERGARYRVVAPAENPDISVPRATSIEGKIFFAGRLQPGVSQVTLSVNDGAGGGTSSRLSSTPAFRVEIPLGG